MKNVLILIGCVLLFHACNESSKPSDGLALDLSGFEIIRLPGSDMSRVIKYGEDGLMKEEGTVRNGKRNGTWVVYHDSKEVPRSIANFVDDRYAGVYMEFNPQGQVTLVCGYIANQLEGKFVRYQLGRKTEEGAYKAGQYDGVFRKFYTGRDIIQQEASYKAGKLDGITKYYSEKGQVQMEYVYKDGEKISGGIVEPEPEAGN